MKEIDRDTFILENMGLVKMVVKRHKSRIYNNPSVDLEDLESVGTIGLIKAYEGFDPNYGTQFSTYAVAMIDGEIRRYFRENLDTIKFTRKSKADCWRIIGLNLINEEPNVIAEKLEISSNDVQNALDYYNHRFTNSLDMPIYEDEGEPIFLADRIGEDVDFDSNLEIELFLDKLDERTRKIVELRLQEKTQVEIGQILGISQVQVSRILSRIQNIYKGGNKVAEKKKERKVTSVTEGHGNVDKKKTPDFTLAKKLAEETELNPSQISKQSGVAYTTARNYVKCYRKKEEAEMELPEEKTIQASSINHRLDIPEEIAKEKTIEEPEVKQADGYMTMTFKLTVENATSQLQDIVRAMNMLGFKDLDVTIQSQQTA